jgi:hypothetical protein
VLDEGVEEGELGGAGVPEEVGDALAAEDLEDGVPTASPHGGHRTRGQLLVAPTLTAVFSGVLGGACSPTRG